MNLKTLVIAAVIAAPVAAMAKAPTPGSYDVSGLQSICINADGTWYGETFSAWGGQWTQVGKTTLIRGNYASGMGNDALNMRGSAALGYNGNWQEWRDDQSYEYANTATMTFQSSSCTPPAASVRSGKQHPTEH